MRKSIVAVIVAAIWAVAGAQTPPGPGPGHDTGRGGEREAEGVSRESQERHGGHRKRLHGCGSRRRHQGREVQGHAERHAGRQSQAGCVAFGDRRNAEGYTGAAGDAAAKAAGDKTPPPPKVKAKAGTPELNKVVP